MGISADLGLIMYGGDATDAYEPSPAPFITYLVIDKAYDDWYKLRTGKDIICYLVMPVLSLCIQGHLESGKLWMHFIDNIIINEMGFKITMHDCFKYWKAIVGEFICLLQ